MAYPPVIIVDKDDQEIGLEMLSKVWEEGLRHRMVRIMAEDKQGRILLQKRSANMTIFPGCWDNSAAGHVDKGMTYLSAAEQEVTEELGIPAPILLPVGRYYAEHKTGERIMNNFNQVYSLKLDNRLIMYEPEEVGEVKWFTRDQLEKLIGTRPELCTPGLRDVVTRYLQRGKVLVASGVQDRTV
jgi:isopentenyl-diphosphate Delta-isomerase